MRVVGPKRRWVLRRVLVLNSQFSRGGCIIRYVFIVSIKSMFLDCTITVSGFKNQADCASSKRLIDCDLSILCMTTASALGIQMCPYVNARRNLLDQIPMNKAKLFSTRGSLDVCADLSQLLANRKFDSACRLSPLIGACFRDFRHTDV